MKIMVNAIIKDCQEQKGCDEVRRLKGEVDIKRIYATNKIIYKTNIL